MKRIMIDKGFLTVDLAYNNSYSHWQGKNFIKYFGATLGRNFDSYRTATFEFTDHDNNTIFRKNGFTDFAEFEQYLRDHISNGVDSYNSCSLSVYLEIDDKIDSPDIYAKNSLYGALQGRKKFRKGRIVESSDTTGWRDTSLQNLLIHLWNNHFSDNLTTTYLQNNPEIKRCFFTRDGDRVGILKDNTELQDMCFNGGYRRIFNATDSDVSGNVLAMDYTQIVCNDSQTFKAGSDGNNPRYYIVESESSHNNVIADDEVGVLPPSFIKNTNGVNYTAIATTGFRWTIAGKEYHALFISPIGFDTIYFSPFNTDRYRVLSVKSYNNGTTMLKEISTVFPGGLGNKIGRKGTSDWVIVDGDTKNNGANQQTEYRFLLQDIASGKCSPLSQSYMKQLKDNRFRFPFFTLIS